jgi:hypothetical protein
MQTLPTDGARIEAVDVDERPASTAASTRWIGVGAGDAVLTRRFRRGRSAPEGD